MTLVREYVSRSDIRFHGIKVRTMLCVDTTSLCKGHKGKFGTIMLRPFVTLRVFSQF